MQNENPPDNFEGWQRDTNGVWWKMDNSGQNWTEPTEYHLLSGGVGIDSRVSPGRREVKTYVPPAYLTDELERWGPMPREAVVLGTAYDKDLLPVLLNTHDEVPGPILVVGDNGAELTSLLNVVAASTIYLHDPDDYGLAVITEHPDKFMNLYQAEAPHTQNMYVPSDSQSAALLERVAFGVQKLVHAHQIPDKVNMLILDDLAALVEMQPQAEKYLNYILRYGPGKRIWPIVTSYTDTMSYISGLLSNFRTRIYGNIQSPELTRWLGIEHAGAQTLNPRNEFVIREGDAWLRFFTPNINPEALHYETIPIRPYNAAELRHIQSLGNPEDYLRRHPHAGGQRVRLRRE